MNSAISPVGETKAAKELLRSTMRQLRNGITRDQATRAARRAAANLLQLIGTNEIRTVGMYAAIATELSTEEAAEALRARGVVLAYPRIAPLERQLTFHRAASAAALVPGALNIREPSAAAELIPLSSIELFIIPGLAFDPGGRRLGWGKGYYDMTLADSPATRVGYAYSCQIVSEVPCDQHDLLMDILITDDGIVHTGARAEQPAR